MTERWTIQKTFTFDSAHYLPHVPPAHKCRRLHGHTYRVAVELAGTELGQCYRAGMLLDYGEIADTVDPIIAELDHRELNGIKGLENPTTEVLARWIYERLVSLPGLSSVTVHESSTTSCEYRRK